MDRVFLDANVLFSAAWRQDSGLGKLWRLKRTTLLASLYAVEEARRNLETDQQRDRLAVFVAACELVGEAIEAAVDGEAALPADDRPILRAAFAGRSTHLLSGDRRAFGRFYGRTLAGIRVLRPGEYLAAKTRSNRS